MCSNYPKCFKECSNSDKSIVLIQENGVFHLATQEVADDRSDMQGTYKKTDQSFKNRDEQQASTASMVHGVASVD